MKVLSICANPKPAEEAVSKQLAGSFIAKLKEINEEVEIKHIDLYQEPPPYYSYDAYKACWYPIFIEGYQPTADDKHAVAYIEERAAEFCEADVLVVATPMWNFSVPAILKAWMDQVLAPNRTFKMTAKGIEPLHKIKKVIMLVSSGGVYHEDDPRDALTSLVRAAFGFIGIEDIVFAWADGQNPLFRKDCAERKATAIEAAEDLAEEVAALEAAE